MKITYAKGIYTLTDDVRTYTYNINNGQLINTKTNNIVSKPLFKRADILRALNEALDRPCLGFYCFNMLEVLFAMLQKHTVSEVFSNNVQLLAVWSVWDKLLNVVPSGYALADGHSLAKLSNKQISKIAKWVQEYNNPNEKVIMLQAFIDRLEVEELAAAYRNLPIDFVNEYREPLKKLYALEEKYRDIALYYFYNQKLYKFRLGRDSRFYKGIGDTYILTYIELCRIMNKTPIKTNNFMREYLETLNAYDLWKITSQQNAFSSQYKRYKENLLFEYSNYQVVLPQLTQDLITEGNEMHHCVGTYIDRVVDGETLIVFIRHKDAPDKCYITAQINPRNGQLGQYYLAYDRCISKAEDIEFKQKYQDWLYSQQWWRGWAV